MRDDATFRVREGYWFRPKRLGWGMTPATWQGWAAIVVFVGVVAAAMRLLPPGGERVVAAIGLTLGFCALVVYKTDGRLAWRWGRR